jgi:hypothetical protein
MYTTCLFCHSDLGTNEVIESFPVGRRLAFDAAQGRLWVVCRKCERWNLTPVEERWEAVEQCERLFSSTRLKVSTDNIGLSRLRDGLELVRIGKPQRPEMAAWRYGDQFGRRRVRYMTYTVGGVALVAGAVIAGPMMGMSLAGGGWGMFQGINALVKAARDRVIRTRVAVPGFDKPSVIRGKDIKRIVLASDGDEWSLRVPYNRGHLTSDDYPRDVLITGEAALRAAATILPAVNVKGGNKEQVQEAVRHLEQTPDAQRLFHDTAHYGFGFRNRRSPRERIRDRRAKLDDSQIFLDRIPQTVLLAMEMAAHEDIERRAMEGELAILEAAWKQAEEIASIADNLLTPTSVEDQFAQLTRSGENSK